MTAWNAGWRFPLYLRIWIAVVVAVGLITIAFGVPGRSRGPNVRPRSSGMPRVRK